LISIAHFVDAAAAIKSKRAITGVVWGFASDDIRPGNNDCPACVSQLPAISLTPTTMAHAGSIPDVASPRFLFETGPLS
jgi:hypothetical protein